MAVLLANAPFVGSSVTLSRARLVAAAVSALEARFDPATEVHNSTDSDFLKEIFGKAHDMAVYAATICPAGVGEIHAV
jgi:hypothetical protein